MFIGERRALQALFESGRERGDRMGRQGERRDGADRADEVTVAAGVEPVYMSRTRAQE